MISISYALTELEITNMYKKLNSFDVLLIVVQNSLLNHTSLEHEIVKLKNDN